MTKFKVRYIIDYFESRGWRISREGESFYYLQPIKINLKKLPIDYTLDIPKDDEAPSFDNYILRLLEDIPSLLPRENTIDDYHVLFSRNHSILKYRFFDHENQDGSIGLDKHIESLDSFKKVLSQTVTFVATKKQIFASAKFEVDEYIKRCKALQTEKGSFISKFEIPNEPIRSAVSELQTIEVNDKLFDVLDYVNSEIIHPKFEFEVNENYIADNQEYINFELLQAIRDIYTKTKINNIEYQLTSTKHSRIITTTRVQPRIKVFNAYLRNLKSILLRSVPLETTGKVKKLTSSAPLTSSRSEVILTAEIANKEENIKLVLHSEEYLQAIEAHKEEKSIRIKGIAQQGKTMLIISDLEEFEVLP